LRSSTEIVQVTDERFLDAVIESGRGNFILERGGEILEDVTKEKMPEILDFLFTRLVAEPERPDEPKSAEEVRDEILIKANVVNDVRVRLDKRIPIKFGEKTVHHEFHFTIGNGKIECVGQVVPLSARPRDVKKSADAIAYRFSNVRSSEIVKSDAKRMVLLYSPSEEDATDDIIKESIIELEHVAEDVIDLNNPKNDAPNAGMGSMPEHGSMQEAKIKTTMSMRRLHQILNAEFTPNGELIAILIVILAALSVLAFGVYSLI
jgi:hypothetical protein